ncbi:MAG: alpha/beta hydrolase [Anaerolineales bacterium]|nr:alpha/beta hydrolase [Anaerolineales bacterium]
MPRSIALSQIALHIPGEVKAESRVTTIRRWLKNLRVDVWEFYRPVLERALQDGRAVTATVILNGVMVFGDRWQIFRLSLAYAGRAIPLGWVVLSGKGLTQKHNLWVLAIYNFGMQRDRVNLNGINIHFNVEGHGPDVLLIHGWSSSRRMWTEVSTALADQFRCWSLDLPGFGESDKPEEAWYSIPNYTEVVYHFVEAMGLRQLRVVGHSMGGLISLDFAATHGERIARLVAINPVVTGRAYLGAFADWQRSVRVLHGAQQLSRRFIQPMLNHPLADRWSRPVHYLRRRNEEFTQATPDSLMHSGRAVVRYDVRPKLAQISAPTLVVLSTFDASVPNSEGHVAAAAIPNARLAVFNAGHTVTDDRPAESLRLIREFLR